MLSRALILATVTLLIGDLAAAPAHAQATNLEAGKSPSQIFAGTCTACHKSPRGLLKTVPAGSLPSFLKQHYTTSPDMAGLLSSYLISNGATDTRYGNKDAKPDGKPEKPGAAPAEQLDRQGHRLHTATPEPAKPEAKPDNKPEAKPDNKPEAEPRQAAKPDTDGVNPQGGERRGRNGKRLARPMEDGAKPAEGEAAAREAGERGPDGRKLTAKQRLSKRGKPNLEEPKDTSRPETAKDTAKDEPATAGPAKEDKPAGEPAKEEAAKPDSVKPSGETKPETAKSDTAKQDTSKPEAAKSDTAKSDPAKTETPKETAPAATPAAAPATSAAAPATTPEPSAGAPARPAPTAPSAAQSAAVETTPPTVSTIPAPPAAAAPTGPPAPPISK
jgi:hypothetical protein